MWIYNVCKVREPEGNGYEILEQHTDRILAYMRMFALKKLDKTDCVYFVERFSDKKKPK